jgi:hypothetical protein
MWGARGVDDDAGIRNIIKNIFQCQDFPLTCQNACLLIISICLKLALFCLLIKGGTFIWNRLLSFPPLSLLSLTLPQNDSISKLHPSSRE